MVDAPSRTRVWDVVVRLCHIIFIVGVVSAFTSYQLGMMQWHMWNGYGVLAALAVRLVWGVVGTPTARFATFVVSPRRVLGYLRTWHTQPVPHGHNPLGGYAVLALLTALASQGLSGLFADDDIMTTGPLAATVSSAASHALTEWHETNFYLLLLPLIGLHITAALVYLCVKKANLIRPMITGYKD